MAGLRLHSPMLHPEHYCSQRRVRGQSYWLSFLCKTLSFSVSSRFIPALSLSSQRTPPTTTDKGGPIYKVGTLIYTPAALLTVMFWMLLGDLCLQIMEQLPTSLVPLQLRWATASDTLIGFIAGSLPAVLGILLNPVIGIQSDRHRGKLGRRRPFLLASTPLVIVALLGLGLATPIAEILGKWTGAQSLAALKIGWLGGCMAVFVVANTYIMQVYQFLFVDVIPKEVMGRFVGCYRAALDLSGVFWHQTRTSFRVCTDSRIEPNSLR